MTKWDRQYLELCKKILKDGIEAKDLGKVLLTGAIFGFMTYATYDLTNLATLKDWPVTITIIDLIWGTFLGGTTSYISYLVITMFFK